MRGRLGLRRMAPVWGGADATPDRAIGQFADANFGVNTVALWVMTS